MTYQPQKPLNHRLDVIAAAFTEFLDLPCWVAWGFGKELKSPWCAHKGQNHRIPAKVSDPSTWCTFSEARAAVQAGYFEGVGIVLSGLSGLAVVDFDDIRDPVTGDIADWASPILKWMVPHTYSEVSCSGCGFHVFAKVNRIEPMCKGAVPSNKLGGEIGKVEFWQNLEAANGRFIALTGEEVDGSPLFLNPLKGAIDYLQNQLATPIKQDANILAPTPSTTPTDAEINEAVAILKHVSPDINYPDWLRILQGIHNKFGGSELGLQIADEWSQRGSKFKHGDVKKRWGGFGIERGVTWNSVCSLARDYGADLSSIAKAVREAGYTKTYNPAHGAKQAKRLLANYQGRKSETTQSKSPYPVVHMSELSFDEPRFLIDGLLEEGTLAIVFGPPGAGKSFVAQDMAACITTGIDFHGHDCKQGRVIYVIGEGKSGVSRRLKAWAIDREIAIDKSIPFEAIPMAVPMLDKQAVSAVCQSIESSPNASSPPTLIILDTLARNFGDGDENSTQDMTRFIAAVHQLMDRFGCAVLVVHHSGHAAPERGRGSSALKGAADAEFRVKQNDKKVISLEHTKSKDGPLHDPMKFTFKPIELGQRRDGSTFGSVVLVPAANEEGSYIKIPKSALIAQKTFEDAAVEYGVFSSAGEFEGVTMDNWRKAFMAAHSEKSADASRQAFSRARKTLVDIEHIVLESDLLVFAGPQKIARTFGVQERRRNPSPFVFGDVQPDNVTSHEKSLSRHSGKAWDSVTDSPQTLKGWGMSHPDGGN